MTEEWQKWIDFFLLVLSALRAQVEAERNEPLTLEELREISQKEFGGCHIWVEDLRRGFIVGAVTDVFKDEVVAVWCAGSDDLIYRENSYGRTWLAYRHNPWEGTK